MKIRQVYLDYASTTPVDPAVLAAMLPYFKDKYGNASSLHRLGREAKAAIEKARQDIAAILNCRPAEIIFTGSSTEADNLAILGAARANRDKGRHVIVSGIEHKAIIEAAKKLEHEGFRTTYLDVKRDGLISAAKLKKIVEKDTILVSISIANNEIGVIQPVAEIAAIIKKVKNGNSTIFHTDAVQAAGNVSLDVNKLGIDLMTLGGSKIYGPKGVGCLYVKSGVKLEPLIVGGEQENHRRAGTENPALIVGFAKALRSAEKLRPKETKRLSGLRDYFIQKTLRAIPGCRLNGHPRRRLPNNVNFSIRGIEGESLILILDKYGIFASTGSACSTSDLEPSHVIAAIGVSPELAHSSVRFTMGRQTTKKDVDYVLKILPQAVAKLRQISSFK